MLSYKILGSNIQKARLRRGFTQEYMAEQMGVNTNYYGRYERGEVKPSLNRLAEICSILSVPIENMFVGTYDHNGNEELLQPDAVVTSFLRMLSCCSDEQRVAITKICEGITALSKDK